MCSFKAHFVQTIFIYIINVMELKQSTSTEPSITVLSYMRTISSSKPMPHACQLKDHACVSHLKINYHDVSRALSVIVIIMP